MVLLFLLFYIVALFFSAKFKIKNQHVFLFLSCILLAIFIGFRSSWPDQGAYIWAFVESPTVSNFSLSVKPVAYAEKGYFLLAGLIKTIYFNYTFYLLSMGLLSMLLLYVNFKKYAVIPLFGLCDYIARFILNRDFTQMRSSLAILIIIYGLKYLNEKKIIPYCLLVLIAYQFHHLALIALPFYFLNMIKLNKYHLVVLLLFAFVASQTFAYSISDVVEQYSVDLQYEKYIEDDFKVENLGILNPMIYFQLFVFILFICFEESIKKITNYYETLRNGYFYSTFILIFFCNYTALSGRTSTLFATYEIFIFPLLLKVQKDKRKILFSVFAGILFMYFFYAKWNMHVIMNHS